MLHLDILEQSCFHCVLLRASVYSRIVGLGATKGWHNQETVSPRMKPAESLRDRRERGPTAPTTVGRGAEASVDRVMVAVAIGMALVFLMGVMSGVVAMVSMASNREDRLGTLTRQPPDVIARGVRRLIGLGLRDITPRDAKDVRR